MACKRSTARCDACQSIRCLSAKSSSTSHHTLPDFGGVTEFFVHLVPFWELQWPCCMLVLVRLLLAASLLPRKLVLSLTVNWHR